MSILITGANGFIGRAVCTAALHAGERVTGAVRRPVALPTGVQPAMLSSDYGSAAWHALLSQHRVVIHTVARVHIMNDPSTDPLASFREVNTKGTWDLARQAAAAGIRRFVFVSSVKVNGEETEAHHPYTSADSPAPQDPYGISKLEAEQGLHRIAKETGMEIVIIRPPLVYGPGVKANFASLLRVLQRGIPLPLGGVTQNRRSLVALDNLVDLLITCVDHPAAANRTFMVSDGEDLSTAALLRRMGMALGHPARLLPVPPELLRLGAAVIGKRNLAQRLLGNLQVDITDTRQRLDWTPRISVDEGLRRVAADMVQR
jgi:nucleoside-diphosphate-sugar epimerase